MRFLVAAPAFALALALMNCDPNQAIDPAARAPLVVGWRFAGDVPCADTGVSQIAASLASGTLHCAGYDTCQIPCAAGELGGRADVPALCALGSDLGPASAGCITLDVPAIGGTVSFAGLSPQGATLYRGSLPFVGLAPRPSSVMLYFTGGAGADM